MKEALKLALYALVDVYDAVYVRSEQEAEAIDKCAVAITAIKEALAQDELCSSQEPLEYWNAVEGWVKIDEVREHFDSVGCGTIYKTAGEGREALYTTPPKRPWVGLTDEEYDEIWRMDLNNKDIMDKTTAKLKEKNT